MSLITLEKYIEKFIEKTKFIFIFCIVVAIIFIICKMIEGKTYIYSVKDVTDKGTIVLTNDKKELVLDPVGDKQISYYRHFEKGVNVKVNIPYSIFYILDASDIKVDYEYSYFNSADYSLIPKPSYNVLSRLDGEDVVIKYSDTVISINEKGSVNGTEKGILVVSDYDNITVNDKIIPRDKIVSIIYM